MTIKPTHARSPAPPRPTEIAATADKTDAANRPSAELPAMSNKNLKDSFEPADTATSPMALAANDANLLNLALSHGGAKNQAQVDEAFRLITGLRVGRTNNYYWEGDPVFTNQDSNGTPSSMHELLATLNSYHVMISPENLARWVDRMFALTVNRDFPYVQREFLDATEDFMTMVQASKAGLETRVNGETLLGTVGKYRDPVAQTMLKRLLDLGASATSLTGKGRPPLLDEEKAGFRTGDGVRALMAHGVSANVASAEGVTPLMQSFEQSAYAALIYGKANIEARDLKGNTPLMHQASSGNVDNIRILIAAKADLGAKNAEGLSALALTLTPGRDKYPKDEMVEAATALIEAGASISDEAGKGSYTMNSSAGMAILGDLSRYAGSSSSVISGPPADRLIEQVVNHPAFTVDRSNSREVNAARDTLRLISGGRRIVSPSTRAKLQRAINNPHS